MQQVGVGLHSARFPGVAFIPVRGRTAFPSLNKNPRTVQLVPMTHTSTSFAGHDDTAKHLPTHEVARSRDPTPRDTPEQQSSWGKSGNGAEGPQGAGCLWDAALPQYWNGKQEAGASLTASPHVLAVPRQHPQPSAVTV